MTSTRKARKTSFCKTRETLFRKKRESSRKACKARKTSFRNSPKIIYNVMKLLHKLNNERRKILFGDTLRFKDWLKEQKVADKVKFKIILIKQP
jgi:hypothetical protein